jgi:ABC-type nitrate/sulfonate/bicarbonate transport system substrate-binding protein
MHLVILSMTLTFGSASLELLSATDAKAETKIVEGYVSDGALQWPEYIADSFGWFKENGVSLEMLAVGSGAATQLAAGSINLGYSGFPDFIRATNQGAPIKIVINGCGEPPYAIYAKPSIKTIADLKGKIVSIGGVKDITLAYTSAFLAKGGVKSTDVDFIYAKATPDRFAALMGGGADAAILYPPFTFRAAAAGMTNLGDVQAALPGFPFTVWATNTDWAAKNRDALLAYVKTYGRAVRWLYDDANKAQAIDLLVKYSHATPKDASDTYDYFVTKLHAFSRTGLIDNAAYKTMGDALVESGDLTQPVPPLSKFFDGSYVVAAWK